MKEKLREIQLKAAGRLVRKPAAAMTSPKAGSKANTGIKGAQQQKLPKIEKAAKITREEASKDAINYIMALIKRDSKPVNPEVNIMIKLFEKMNENKSKTKYFDELQAYLKYRLNQIRLESSRRGQLLPIEIEEGAKQALQLLNSAFTAIDREEEYQKNTAGREGSSKKLTSIQRGRMALNFLEMNR